MIYIVKQWRYKYSNTPHEEAEAVLKAFTSKEKAIEYIDFDIESKSTLDTVEVDEWFMCKHVFHGKYGDCYQIIELELE